MTETVTVRRDFDEDDPNKAAVVAAIQETVDQGLVVRAGEAAQRFLGLRGDDHSPRRPVSSCSISRSRTHVPK